jgi:hypothetical protein
LSFYLFVVLSAGVVVASLAGRSMAGEGEVMKVKEGAGASKRVWSLWGILTVVMIILYILFNCHSAKAQSWIGYPGDYEVWLGNKMQNRRTERGSFFPPFWKLDNHYVLIDFRKDFQLSAPTDVEVLVEGRYNIKLDGKMVVGPVHVAAGAHSLELKVFNQDSPPAIYIRGRGIVSDSTWRVTFEDKEWIDASGKTSDKSGTVWMQAAEWGLSDPAVPPSKWKLATRPVAAARIERSAHGMLVDFGKETFGYVRLRGVRGHGRVALYYGESKEEALSVDSCETLDRLEVDRDTTLTGSRAFRYVNIQLDEGVQIDSASMLYEYLPVADRGSFRCNDEELNKIWQVADYTLHLNTREFFIDGIKRDRWIWSGDAYQSYLMNYYLFFDSAEVVRTLWALRGKDPVTSHINTIMDYSFYWFMGIYDYYLYTGDAGFIRQCYPRMVSLMNFILSRRDKNGWLEGLPGDWLFIDWADGLTKQGELSFEQLLFVRSLETMALCARLTGDEVGAKQYRSESDSLRGRLFTDFWDAGRKAFVHSRVNGVRGEKITRYTNMFGIFFHYLSKQQQEDVKTSVLLNDSIQKITTPYMRFYELEALCVLGGQDRVLKEMKDYWGGMLKLGATSFWEKYDPTQKGVEHYAMYGRPFGKSLCHAWGASPLYLLGKYYLGVRPLSAGYASYVVAPVLGGLEWMEGEVPTPHGNIKVYCSRKKMVIHTVEGKGVLQLRSRQTPVCKDGAVRRVGEDKYEMDMEGGREYTVSYKE